MAAQDSGIDQCHDRYGCDDEGRLSESDDWGRREQVVAFGAAFEDSLVIPRGRMVSYAAGGWLRERSTLEAEQ